MSQLNVLVIHVRLEQSADYEELFRQEELPRWREYHRRGKFLSARFFRSQLGTDEREDVVKYVIAVEVPSMAEHSEHDSDPGFQEFDREVERFQPEPPLVYGGELIHSIG
jgi:hypothetical protein